MKTVAWTWFTSIVPLARPISQLPGSGARTKLAARAWALGAVSRTARSVVSRGAPVQGPAAALAEKPTLSRSASKKRMVGLVFRVIS